MSICLTNEYQLIVYSKPDLLSAQPIVHPIREPVYNPDLLSAGGTTTLDNLQYSLPTVISKTCDVMQDSIVRRDFADYHMFISLRNVIADWSQYWGGIDCWQDTLDDLFRLYDERGAHSLDIFL